MVAALEANLRPLALSPAAIAASNVARGRRLVDEQVTPVFAIKLRSNHARHRFRPRSCSTAALRSIGTANANPTVAAISGFEFQTSTKPDMTKQRSQ